MGKVRPRRLTVKAAPKRANSRSSSDSLSAFTLSLFCPLNNGNIGSK
jgi:hypothetical protein